MDSVADFTHQSKDSGVAHTFNGDQVFPTASTIKVPLLVELFRQDQEGAGAHLLDCRVEFGFVKLRAG